jgi:hypothetical protein
VSPAGVAARGLLAVLLLGGAAFCWVELSGPPRWIAATLLAFGAALNVGQAGCRT